MAKRDKTVMDGVREYAESYPVELSTEQIAHGGVLLRQHERDAGGLRLVVLAKNEGGCNGVAIDLLDLLAWLRVNRPDLLAGGES